jgi:hypothetical protein
MDSRLRCRRRWQYALLIVEAQSAFARAGSTLAEEMPAIAVNSRVLVYCLRHLQGVEWRVCLRRVLEAESC